ncbi:hypothetical protein VFPPC_07228 [Pochonia chlamydosporia 170]|uniref:Uncharacterized protein n=1 Tax=Pochonia chlamydosporia 170 TaxID=1380566 RepID=A0A179FAF3_METCM|nr:hypothetical protein VFPPC_07228 [Pochonia chlamydosporia 170]OAQ62089.2 hypothetical protein VFPPC_07228 [Pochonia chlamydosporia 170]
MRSYEMVDGPQESWEACQTNTKWNLKPTVLPFVVKHTWTNDDFWISRAFF